MGGNPESEIRSPKTEGFLAGVRWFFSAFGFRNSFGFRISAFGLFPLLLLLLLAALTPSSRAASAADDFAAANQLVEQGRYADAIAAYEKMAQGGPATAALYYNLGLAHFRAGHIGRAILAYRQAERLAPRDPDIRANLLALRRAVAMKEEVGPRGLEAFLMRLTLNEWTLLTMACLWLWLGVLAAGQWRAAWRAGLRGYAWGGLVLLLAASGCLGGAAYYRLGCVTAIVVERSTPARQAPYEVSRAVLTLPDGMELSVIREDKGWLEIRDAAGRAGWLKRDQVVVEQ
jgi:tetratricopeptide (TPR) repeat protein